ncbi:unnamed protein product [Mycena citricolor]|uniref:LIM zinc-binding domain-containing protein n=1 Tax=Mycena citricolor TaxID=2018698 RepID=A0AAD2GWQ9_9AGAR|nr:unnamed protein product [Mycena citricolor]
MGFCRRCGNIVTGDRCRCGGLAVAPVVPWNQSNPKEKTQDRWSKTYVSKDRSPSPTRADSPTTATTSTSTTPAPSSSPTKRFPRPMSQSSQSPLSNRVSAYITATTTGPQSSRPPSPLKYSSLAAAESGILPSLHDNGATLAKVYGSVLQPRETLPVQACARCGSHFSPTESTIYPDPNDATGGTPRFLCRNCFVNNGGSRGPCAECSRPVLILKSDGGFVHAGDRFWHKKCFMCDGCDKYIGDSPMVDLLGRPSCSDCFDTCLERDSTPKKKKRHSTSSSTVDRNLGGMASHSKSKSREGSPALEELEQRLGIVRTREASPALEELSQRLSMVGKESPGRSPQPSRYSTPGREDSPFRRSRTKSDPLAEFSPSPSRRYTGPQMDGPPSPLRYASKSPSPTRESPGPSEDAIAEMKRRFSNGPVSTSPSGSPLPKPRLRHARSSGRLSSSASSVPDLTSDSSDATSSAGPDSPPRGSGSVYDVDPYSAAKVFTSGYGSRYTRELKDDHDIIVEETKSQLNTPAHTPTHTPKSTVKSKSTPSKSPIPFNARSPKGLSVTPSKLTSSSNCFKCRRSLFSVEEGGRYVTVPDDVTGEPLTYHTDCFVCVVCSLPFKEGAVGQALFVKGPLGPSHVQCAPPEKVAIRTVPTSKLPVSIFSSRSPHSSPQSKTPEVKTASIATSGRFDRPPVTAPASTTPISFPRFGAPNACPGCHVAVSVMERGVVQGPQGSRWHASCLVCGGKKPPSKGWLGRDERKKGVPGCGKKLDSAAKSDIKGMVWCRECSLLLPLEMRGSPHGSPTRGPIVPSNTGSSSKITAQMTGTTTIARQFTGHSMHSLDSRSSSPIKGLTHQWTGPSRSISPTKGLGGGPLNPTRSISPTKGQTLRPRPKSVVGIRNTNIVRQMTGGSIL